MRYTCLIMFYANCLEFIPVDVCNDGKHIIWNPCYDERMIRQPDTGKDGRWLYIYPVLHFHNFS